VTAVSAPAPGSRLGAAAAAQLRVGARRWVLRIVVVVVVVAAFVLLPAALAAAAVVPPPGAGPLGGPGVTGAAVLAAGAEVPRWLLDTVAHLVPPLVVGVSAVALVVRAFRAVVLARLGELRDPEHGLPPLLAAVDGTGARLARGDVDGAAELLARLEVSLERRAAVLRSRVVRVLGGRQRRDELAAVDRVRAQLLAARAAAAFFTTAATASAVHPALLTGYRLARDAVDAVAEPVDWVVRLRGQVDRVLVALLAAPAPPAELGPRVWDLLVRRDVGDRDLVGLLGGYLRAGGGAAGTRAFEVAWLRRLAGVAGFAPAALRLRAPPDRGVRVAGRRLVVRTVRDPVEILRLAGPVAVLHPDVVVLQVAERRSGGAVLGVLVVLETGRGLLVLDVRPTAGSELVSGRLLGHHLAGWGADRGVSIELTAAAAGVLGLDVGGVPAELVPVHVRWPGLGPVEFSSALTGPQLLPYSGRVSVHRWHPPPGPAPRTPVGPTAGGPGAPAAEQGRRTGPEEDDRLPDPAIAPLRVGAGHRVLLIVVVAAFVAAFVLLPAAGLAMAAAVPPLGRGPLGREPPVELARVLDELDAVARPAPGAGRAERLAAAGRALDRLADVPLEQWGVPAAGWPLVTRALAGTRAARRALELLGPVMTAGRDRGAAGPGVRAEVWPLLAAVAGAPEVGQRLGSVRRAVFSAVAAEWSRVGPAGWGPTPAAPPQWLVDRLGRPRRLEAWWVGAEDRDRAALAVAAVVADDLGVPRGQVRAASGVDALVDAARRELVEGLGPDPGRRELGRPVEAELVVEVLQRVPEWSDRVTGGLAEHVAQQRRDVAEIGLLRRFVSGTWTEGARMWAQAADLLGELAERPVEDRTRRLPPMTAGALLVLLRSLREDLHADGPGYEFLAEPGRVAAVVATAGGDLDQLAADWARDSVRTRLIRLMVWAVIGARPWMGRVPRRSWTVARMGGVIRWHVDPRFARHLDLTDAVRDAALAGADDVRQNQVLSAWLTLLDSLARMPEPADEIVAELVPRVLGRLLDTLPTALPTVRVSLLGAARAQVRRAWVRSFAAHRYGLDPDALPVPVDSPVWDVVAGHDDVSDPVTTAVLTAYVRAGGGAAGIEAADRVWLDALAAAGERSEPLRLLSPSDRVVRVAPEPGVAGSGSDVVIGVARDHVDIMGFGLEPFDSCLNCVDGSHRDLAQAYLLRPDVAVVYLWSRAADGSRGALLGAIPVIRTRAGLLPLTNRVITSSMRPFAPAVVDFLRGWAADLGTPLLIGEWQEELLPADPGPAQRIKIVIPAPPFGPTLWADALDTRNAVVLPFSKVLHVHQLRGPPTRADGGGGFSRRPAGPAPRPRRPAGRGSAPRTS
jgi:hypothetical protein